MRKCRGFHPTPAPGAILSVNGVPINSFQEVPISLKMMTDGEEELLKRINRAVFK